MKAEVLQQLSRAHLAEPFLDPENLAVEITHASAKLREEVSHQFDVLDAFAG